MSLVRPLGCRLCGAYVVAVGVIAHELVVVRGATGPIAKGRCYNAAQRSMHICIGELQL